MGLWVDGWGVGEWGVGLGHGVLGLGIGTTNLGLYGEILGSGVCHFRNVLEKLNTVDMWVVGLTMGGLPPFGKEGWRSS